MRFIFLIACLHFITQSLIAQKIQVRVLGESFYEEQAEAYGIVVSFDTDSLVLQKQKFIDAIQTIGIKSKLEPTKDFLSIPKKKKFRIEEKNSEIYKHLLTFCRKYNIKIEKSYFKMPEHKFIDEDEKAVLALDNAVKRVKIIAKNLGYEVTKILNIDDDTTESSYIYEIIDKDSRYGKLMIELIEALSSIDNTEYSSYPVRERGYNLWVTFELKAKGN